MSKPKKARKDLFNGAPLVPGNPGNSGGKKGRSGPIVPGLRNHLNGGAQVVAA